jgi:hypothetical protein
MLAQFGWWLFLLSERQHFSAIDAMTGFAAGKVGKRVKHHLQRVR